MPGRYFFFGIPPAWPRKARPSLADRMLGEAAIAARSDPPHSRTIDSAAPDQERGVANALDRAEVIPGDGSQQAFRKRTEGDGGLRWICVANRRVFLP
jgi:hypothetical protein